jgi:hypothetical protein
MNAIKKREEKRKGGCPKVPVNDSRFANMVWMEQRNRMNEGRRKRRNRNQVEQRSESEACLGDEARNEEQEKGLRMYSSLNIFDDAAWISIYPNFCIPNTMSLPAWSLNGKIRLNNTSTS